MQNERPVPGQRWVSDSEPELGLGIILKVEANRLEILFPAADERRLYSLESSHLRRVVFREADRITLHDGREAIVRDVVEEDGLLTYQTDDRPVPETELSDTISFSTPVERLLGGQTSFLQAFELRTEALERWSGMLGSPVRGYAGGRIDLIPHQLSIAVEVCSRLKPRVLLADEVGLGKTIEAGLILHRLHLTGRADRILVIVPEPLVHQWLVEMLRRFNLSFNIFDEERCQSIERLQPDANPFLENQIVLCSVNLLTNKSRRAAQVLEAGWDMLVVDEAHHLEWSPEQSGPSYKLVEALAARVPSVLLLTATPQQLGPEGHFARLRLLDPDRYADLDTFLEESAGYERVARAVDSVLGDQPLTEEDRTFFAGHSERVRRHFRAMEAGETSARQLLVEDLLDSFGTGRVMFRNTRAALSGFPERKVRLTSLPTSGNPAAIRLNWLTGLLKELDGAKALLICSSREMAEEIYEYLQVHTRIQCALFHEGLTLVQRDRNAAYFAEPDGAQILVSSEIGSEGRNFQFAHDLIMFDLPANPDLLEQRIGRLDRIGQTATVNIHVPFQPGTASEVLSRWYHEGLNAFEQNLHGAAEIYRRLEPFLHPLLENFDENRLSELVQRSLAEREQVTNQLAKGYDRLLELNSNKPEKAQGTAELIRKADSDRSFERFFLRLLEYFGMSIDESADRIYRFRPDYLVTDQFPPLPSGGMWATFDRTRALSREDLAFITQDHPFVLSVMELFLEGEHGNATFGIWEDADENCLLVEIIAVVECVAPASLHVNRFLPPTPIRAIADHRLEDRTEDIHLSRSQLSNAGIEQLLEQPGFASELFPSILDAALEHAGKSMESIVGEAISTMSTALRQERERLEDLQQINDNVTDAEIEENRAQEEALREAIASARLRISALRLVRGEEG